MSTARRTWQKFEQRAAALFGALRQRGSGSGGRPDQSCSDSTHPSLYLECKLRAKHAARALYDDTRTKAKKEGKIPVLALADKGRPGMLICVHSDDLEDFTKLFLDTRESANAVRRGDGPGDGLGADRDD